MALDGPLIELEEVSFEYPDGTEVFNEVSLTINEGDFVVVLAPNGGGKSTLLKLLCGLLEPTSGSVRFKENPIDSYENWNLYRQMGFVFQNPDDQLFGATVKEDVAFGPRNLSQDLESVNDRVNEALRDVELEVDPNKPVHRLSFGQRKRVALAGILAMGADTLLLDEPTGELDPRGQENIFGLLQQFNRKNDKTIVMATHHIDLLGAPFETVCVIENNDCLVKGSPKDIFFDEELLRTASLRPPIALQVCRKLMQHEGLDAEHLSEAQEDLWRFLEEHFW